MHAERLLQSICVQSLVLIAQAVFILRVQTDKQTNKTDRHTDATERPTQAGVHTAGVGNDKHLLCGMLHTTQVLLNFDMQ